MFCQMHNVITGAKLCKERGDEETRSSQGLNTDSLTSPWREGENVPMPYGKSHSFTATWLGHGVKGAALAKVHHSLFQPQFHALQSLF